MCELLVYYFHTVDQDLEIVQRVRNLLVDFNVDGSFDDGEEEFNGAHLEHIVLFQLFRRDEALNLKLVLRLLSLLYQVTAAIYDLGFHQPFLVQLAWSLNNLDQRVYKLHAQLA